MAMKKINAEAIRATGIVSKRAGKSRDQQMEDFRLRAERISRSLEGRKHSDSAALIREDRRR